MKKQFVLLMFFPSLAFAQTDQGIKFDDAKNWQALLTKAEAKNEYIFIDCFTTWCGPCRELRDKVFTQREVGEYFNAKFLSVSVQFDSTALDGDAIKAWYPDVGRLQEQYGYAIKGFPTLLFFSPEGKLVNSVTGLQDKDALIASGEDAIQYGQFVKEYSSQKHDGSTQSAYPLGFLEKMIRISKRVQDNTSNTVAAEYFNRLLSINESGNTAAFTHENVKRLAEFTTSSADPGFQIFYRYKSKIDQVMQDTLDYRSPPSYTNGKIDEIIIKEGIENPFTKAKQLSKSEDLPWDDIKHTIEQKYGKPYADRITGSAKSAWYKTRTDQLKDNSAQEYEKNRQLLCKSSSEFLKHFSSEISQLSLKEKSRDLLMNCADRDQLSVAVEQMAALVAQYQQPELKVPAWARADEINLYANLLYKIGNASEAIQWEETALKVAKADDTATDKVTEYQEVLSRMKQSTLVWPQS